MKCEFGSLDEVEQWRVRCLCSSLIQNSEHFVRSRNLNTSCFQLTCNGTWWTIFVLSQFAIEYLLTKTNGNFYISLLSICDAVLRSSDIQSGCIIIFTMLHYLLTSVTKIRETISFGNIFELYVYIGSNYFSLKKFLLLTNAFFGFFFCTYWGLLQFCLILSFILFLDTIF